MIESVDNENTNLEFVVWARVVLSGASMTVSAKTAAEARAIAEANPDFDFSGAGMVDWEITGADEALP